MPYYLSEMDGKERLVKASTVAGARNHLIKPLVPECKMLDTDGVVEALGRGLAIEDASAEVEPAKGDDK